MKRTILILIVALILSFIYLTILKIQLRPSGIAKESKCLCEKTGDTIIVYSNPFADKEEECKNFIIMYYSSDYEGAGCEGFKLIGGLTVLYRKFNYKDSVLIYKNQLIYPGKIYEDTVSYISITNIFKTIRNRIVIRNHGYVKWLNVLYEQKKIHLNRQEILICADSYESYVVNKSVIVIYYCLPFVLFILGFVYWRLRNYE